MTYSEKLKDPRWQKLRLWILSRDNFTCLECEDKESTLHVHHRYYVKGRDPWNYPEWSLVTLCKACHSILEERGQECWQEWEYAIEMMCGNLPGKLEYLHYKLDNARCDLGLNPEQILRRIALALNEPKEDVSEVIG